MSRKLDVSKDAAEAVALAMLYWADNVWERRSDRVCTQTNVCVGGSQFSLIGYITAESHLAHHDI